MARTIRAKPSDYESRKPSEVVAERLREKRKARGLSQEQLAEMLTRAGTPMSKWALLAIEKGKRGLSLDEALAIATVLNAVPEQMLTPPEGVFVRLTDKVGADGSSIREFMRYGIPWSIEPAREDVLDAARERHHERLTQLALAVTDATLSRDQAGTLDALGAITNEVLRHERELRGAPSANERSDHVCPENDRKNPAK
jgi:transcriptional regulator with XRE-family HTH domain